MLSRCIPPAIAALTLLAGPAQAETEKFDLANAGVEETRQVKVGTTIDEIQLDNRLLGSAYNSSIEVVTIEEDPLSTEFFSFGGSPLRQPSPPDEKGRGSAAGADDLCAAIADQLKKAVDESDVARIRRKATAQLSAAQVQDLATFRNEVKGDRETIAQLEAERKDPEQIENARRALENSEARLRAAEVAMPADPEICLAGSSSTETIHPLTLAANQQMVITIERQLPTPKKWVRTLTTGKAGKWYTTYGFTFLPSRDRSFFSKQESTTPTDGTAAVTTFRITEEADRGDLEFRPSILFHYQLPHAHNHSLVAGLGYDLENIALFAGYGYTFHSNLTLTGGLAIHEQQDLAGRYSVGEPLKEAIDSAQLVSKSFGANLYLGVSFRFGTNIFGERDAAATQAAQRRATAAEAAANKANAKSACVARVEATRVEAVAACDGASGNPPKCDDLDGEDKATCETAAVAAKAQAKDNCLKVAEAKAAADKAACAVDPVGVGVGAGAGSPPGPSPGASDDSGGSSGGAGTSAEAQPQDTARDFLSRQESVAAGERKSAAEPHRSEPTPAQWACMMKAELKRAEDDRLCLEKHKATRQSEPLQRELQASCFKVSQRKENVAKAECFVAPAAPAGVKD